MRITNNMMLKTTMSNIYGNKENVNTLNNQMSSQKKISRPSEDPVVAIRALRLRSSVSELSQFYEKNSPDAESWLEVTGKALETVTDVLTDLSSKATKAANKDLKSEDLQIYVEQMKSLRNEFYSTGNVDYAGRYVFTGYRTDTSLTFGVETEKTYTITEQLGADSLDELTYVDVADLDTLTEGNAELAALREELKVSTQLCYPID